MNTKIIHNFELLIQQKQEDIQILKDNKGSKKKITTLIFKVKNFNKALKILKSIPNEITSVEQLVNIKGIGPGIVKRIHEILTTGTLSSELRVVNSNSNSNKRQIIMDLQRVTGIGPSNAKKLYDVGITLENLLKKNSDFYPELTHHQALGIKYFHETEERIPRAEIDKIKKLLEQSIYSIDPEYTFMICGSYRRGCPNSGDIDMLIKHNKIQYKHQIESSTNKYLQEIVEILTDDYFLIDHLTENGKTKYMGYCKLSPSHKARRIDIRFVSCEDFYPAVLYFTGSGDFNKNMRNLALKKNYTLNEYGIFEIKSNKGGKIEKGKKIKVKSEEEIFDILGMEYVIPTDRNI